MPISHVKHALLLMEWQLFSPSPTLQEQKPLGSGVTDFFVMSLPIFRTVVQGVDLLFDRYVKNSIKEGARDKREEKKRTGIRRNVGNRDQRIENWEEFRHSR